MVDDSIPERLLAQECYELSELTNPWVEMASAKELLSHLEDRKQEHAELPALVLLDINMPHMSGFDALTFLRREAAFRELPAVFMLTNSSNPDDHEKARALGADDYHTKPDNVGDYIDFFNGLPDRLSA